MMTTRIPFGSVARVTADSAEATTTFKKAKDTVSSSNLDKYFEFNSIFSKGV